MTVKVSTGLKKQGTRELTLDYRGGDQTEDSKTPDSDGKCEWKPTVDSDARDGDATVRVKVSHEDDTSEATQAFTVQKK